MHQVAQGGEAFVRALNRLRASGISVPAWVAQLPIAGKYLDLWWRANLSNDFAAQTLKSDGLNRHARWRAAGSPASLRSCADRAFLDTARWNTAVATARRLLGYPGIHLIGRNAHATRATVNCGDCGER